ncbi:hypothetical protein PV327_002057 [Microctonus hyperodae]|uniref:Large ribosomal subunit protein mL52 n=1 Tax=Microctonus hyperodae TaxID=165561 RepID=A0AA39KNP1_MICHY|nr:hypothetical protein PV327_002057 [Microctonus hyperodae]
MALNGQIIMNIKRYMNINIMANGFHSSARLQLNQRWRREKRLTENPNAFGPLTNLPDYSFLDGRPTPFGIRQLARINEQREILQKVRKLTYEVDHAVEKHARMKYMNAQNRKSIIEGKLKEKGQCYLNEPNTNKLE